MRALRGVSGDGICGIRWRRAGIAGGTARCCVGLRGCAIGAASRPVWRIIGGIAGTIIEIATIRNADATIRIWTVRARS